MSGSDDAPTDGSAQERRVLVVDDDPDFAEALEELLEEHGYWVEIRHDRARALAALDGLRTHVALVDLHLGQENGLEVVAELKRRCPDLMCIMITAHAELDSALKALRAGADDYLRKPLHPGELLATLERSFHRIGLELDKRRALAALRDSEERYRRLVEVSPDAIFVIADERIVFASPTALHTLGAESEDELIGRPILEIIHPDCRGAFGECMTSAIDGDDGSALVQSSFIDRKGRDFPAECSASPIVHGGRPAILCIVRDITERLRVDERLRQAQRMETVGQLTSGVAHDFNNLLAMIMGSAELLSDEVGADHVQVRAIMRASERGAALVQRLLAFSRQQVLAPERVAVSTLIADMTDMLRRTLGGMIRIEVDAIASPWTIRADPGQLENAVLNLALNARDAMPQGGTLSIETTNIAIEDDSKGIPLGDYVRVTVTDDGQGMHREVLERAFEPFFTTKDVGQGSGLGLSMVYGFAHQSGGHVTLDSELGRGTAVTLHLPRWSDPTDG